MSKVGPMHLLEVKRLVTQNKGDLKIHIIMGQGWKLVATSLHAFTVLRDGEEYYLPTYELRSGDKIWVDTVAFLTDGSLHGWKKVAE